MAFRALLFSKSSETNTAITAACKSAGIRVEVRSDIFSAIDQAKTRAFSCVIVDWADQPEATFLLKRARESAPNRETISIAVVDHEPTAAEMRDNRLDSLIYRPISADEANAVLAKASEKMQASGAEDDDELSEDSDANNNISSAASSDSELSGHHPAPEPSEFPEDDIQVDDNDGEIDGGVYQEEPRKRSRSLAIGAICVALLAFTAVFWLSRSHDGMEHLSQAPLGVFRALRQSVAALFHTRQPVGSPVISVTPATQQDAYFNRDANSNVQAPALDVVATTSMLADAPMPLPKASDFPLPVPVFERPTVAPIRARRAAIPESMRNSPPIAPPVVVTVNPAQMMPVSAPQSQPAIQQVREPVAVSEEAARALLIHSVNPVYPPEGLPQKLHGPVVLQALIARDGSVEDLKIVRGYFVLGRAAIAAVKQWRFQPYTINGHAASTQTVITITFSYPPS
jgi:TonB family protein